MKKTLCVLIVLSSCSFIYAADYYVSPTGSDSNSGTIDYPFATIGKAVSTVSAGDTIYLRGGTYSLDTTITISKSGTSSSSLNLLAYPSDMERPVLDFSLMAEDSGNRGIRLSASYWYIQGLDIYGAGDNGMNVSGSYNIIEYCRFYENHDTGLQLGGGAAYNQIINCDSFYNADSSLENADGFAPKLDVGTGNYFYGCRAWQNLDDGYDGYLRPADGILTTYENCWAFKNGYLKSGAASGGDGNGFKMGGSDDKTLRHNVLLINCLSFENAVKGFDQNNNKGSMTLYNCTGFNNGTYNFSLPSTLLSGETATITNCVSYGSPGLSLNGSVVQITDSWLSPFTVTGADFISIDPAAAYGPRNADGSLPDISFMHLAAGSDLIDAGTNVGLPYEGAAPDLGAYEYTQADLPPAAPTGPMATAGDGQVSLDWDDSSEPDLAGYHIYRSSIPGSGYVKLNSVLLETSNYDDSTVANTISYYYVITAVDISSNESAYSSEVSATPTVYGDFIINGTVDQDDLDYLAALWLENDCELSAAVDLDDNCIVNLYEFSAFAANWMIVEEDVTPPSAPTGLSAAAGDGTVSLDWNDNGEGDVEGYNVYRSTTAGSDYTQLNTALVTTSDYTDNAVVNGTPYYYVVTAVDTSANESDKSTEESATPDLPTSSITIQENETGFCGIDATGTIDSDNAGYTGDGFANTQNAIGEGIDYRVNILTPGTYTFSWTYANNSSDRPANLIIDNTPEVFGISFPSTGDWEIWNTLTAVEVTLTAGVKDIRLEATTSGGLANIDYMQITGPNLTAATCP